MLSPDFPLSSGQHGSPGAPSTVVLVATRGKGSVSLGDWQTGGGGLRGGRPSLSLLIMKDPRKEIGTPLIVLVSWSRTEAYRAAMTRDPSPSPFILSLNLGLDSQAGKMGAPLSL